MVCLEDEEPAFKDLIASTIGGVTEAVKDTNLAVLGLMEFELSVITKKIAGGKLRLALVEAGGDYQKEEISKIKFSIGSKSTEHYRLFGWK